MPTQEERLASLESFRTETLYAYKDMAYEMTIVKGLGEDSIKRLAELRREANQHFDETNDRLNQMYDEINAHTLLLHQILERLPEKE
jgi:hypothetical protein